MLCCVMLCYVILYNIILYIQYIFICFLLEEVVVKNKLALLYAGLARLDYPDNWPSAWQDDVALS